MSDGRGKGVVVRVLGASGGLGASTLAVAVGVVAARAGRQAVVVDGEVDAGVLDVTAGVEHVTGLRWADLVGVRGEVDGGATWQALPAVEGARVLAGGAPSGGCFPLDVRVSESTVPYAGAWPPTGPGARVAVAVLRALARSTDLVVVDVGRTPWHDGPVWGGDGGLLARSVDGPTPDVEDVLVAGTTARQVADAASRIRCWPDRPLPHLVVRGPAELGESLASHLDVPLLGCWPDDARTRQGAERAVPPGSRKGRLADLAATVVELGTPWWQEVEPPATTRALRAVVP